MFYTAILLILVGLFSLSYLFFTLSVQRSVEPEERYRPAPATEVSSHGEASSNRPGESTREYAGSLPRALDGTEALSSPRSTPDAATSTPVAERNGAGKDQGAGATGTNTADRKPSPSERPPLRPRRLIVDMQRLSETVRALDSQQTTAPEQEPPTLSVDGILFLDQARVIPSMAGRLERLHPRFFSQMKRAGRGNMVLQGNVFHIHCGHTDHIYTSGDLEQILFLRKGVALIPLGRSQVIPVFITDESSRIKEYIKRHTRVTPA